MAQRPDDDADPRGDAPAGEGPDSDHGPASAGSPAGGSASGSTSGSTSGSAPDAAPGSPDDFDARWAQIVADLGGPDGMAWQSEEGGASDERDTSGQDVTDRRGGHVVRGADEHLADEDAGDEGVVHEGSADERVLSGRDWAGTDQFDAAERAVDEQEHFVPPDPGPVLGNDPLRVLTWSVAVGVPVLYVVLLVAWHDPPGWLAPVAGVLLLAAIAVLVWRMPHRRDHDDDSGAVV